MITHVHHINFIVKDLSVAIERYETLLGKGKFILDSLEQRAVKTARAKLGDTWIVLVQPTDPTGVPGQYLEQHGEGFFLLSLGTENLETELIDLYENSGLLPSSSARPGLENWLVSDLPQEHFLGTQIQLCEEVNTPDRAH